LLFTLLFAQFLRFVSRAPTGAGRNLPLVLMGVTAGLLFLARTDTVFLLATLGIWFVLDARRHGRPREWLRFALPAAAIAAVYLTINLWTTGHLMPVSGAGKMYHSGVARAAAAAAAEGGSLAAAVLANALWPVTDPAPWALVCLGAPLMLVVAARSAPRAAVLQTWPFALAIWATFAFYGTAFYGGFTRTLWYYGPTILLGWFYLAALGDVLTRLPVFRPIPWMAPFVLAGVGLRWLTGVPLVAALAGPSVTSRLATIAGPGLRVVGIAALGASIGYMWWTFATEGIWLATWVRVAVVSAILGGFISVVRYPRLALAQVVAGLVIPAALVHGKNLAGDVTTPPFYWNYHLYQGAAWARAALPPDATIWSGSAGILGYFSDRRVVNTDGLANSYAFLENYLRPKRLGEFVTQFDYAIDAFADESLARYYPAGCFVRLPDGVAPPPFQDGALTPRLRVFQMRCASGGRGPD
jgi:hypothetical protein